ncbi:DUF2797 domain-containing protein [Bacteroides sp. 224]|uniref:DUF2797 domain-containing protein n=1 Tax=Bacteroides sp. 224 TaxID=2302936 RepID=UPI0019402343|nr:DUF2797 domain-containing protein [Bacteroides sp. 224]
MITEHTSPIQYYLKMGEEMISVNEWLGKKIKIRFNHYQCLECGQEKEIYTMGHCKNCYFSSPYTGQWIIKPELCTAHLGKEDRNLEIEALMQFQPHIVYLANSGGIKVGVTRKSQIPTRWIDQGAEYALPLAETANRYEAGAIEVALKQHLADKTNYRKMLSGQVPFEDLALKKKEIHNFIPEELQHYILKEEEIVRLEYPVHQYPTKINSVNLKKTSTFEGVLTGIKGQYLIFNNNFVFNVRSHEGFVVDWEVY